MTEEEVAEIEQNENDVAIESQQPIKKPRTEKQIAATQKMLAAKELKRKEMEELRRLREEKKAEEEEKMRKKVEDKIVKKAINIKKKHVTKKEILERILEETDSEPDSEPEKIERKRPIAKKKPKVEVEQVTKKVVVPNQNLDEYPRKFIFLK
jgi:hypothetical protein